MIVHKNFDCDKFIVYSDLEIFIYIFISKKIYTCIKNPNKQTLKSYKKLCFFESSRLELINKLQLKLF